MDTSARIQTVWQVKLFAVDDGVTCSTEDEDIDDWLEFTLPSGARLTSRANPASAVDDPCLLPPEGGYRGLENRTYMVAIHDINEDGDALIKLSRVNGAFAGRILAQPANNTLTLEQVAKDDYLRFNAGDWAEITDDVRVLEGNPGTMVRVLSVDDASNTIVLEAPLAAGEIMLVPASTAADQSVHPILRRWDQSGIVLDTDGNEIVNLDAAGSDGLIPAPEGVFIALEDGVEIAITLDDEGLYHVGDNWSFITRYADSSVEELNEAPPQAFHHHFCRLAVVDVEEGEFVEPIFQDCRDPIGTAGCCTVVVRPGEDIQTALDSLSPEFGGCVCLKVGIHTIRRPLRIRYPNVTLHGESHGAQIRNLSGGAAIDVFADDGGLLSGIHITTIGIQLEGGTEKSEGVITLRNVQHSLVEDCRVLAAGEQRGGINAAVALFGCEGVRVMHCRLAGTSIGVLLDNGGEDLLVEGNDIDAQAEQQSGLIGVAVAELTGRARVLNNNITGYVRGVTVNNQPLGAPFSTASHSEVVGNRIALGRMQSDQDAIAIESNCTFGTVSENQITLAAEDCIGIVARGVGSLVERNRIESREEFEQQIGVLVGDDVEVFSGGITVAQNWIRGCAGGVVADNVAGIRIDNNDISGDGGGVEVAISVSESSLVSIENNTVVTCSAAFFTSQCEDVQISSNQIRDDAAAIACERCVRVDITNNQVSDCSHGGIFLFLCIARGALIGNRLNNVGARGASIFASSIMCLFHLGECHIESNEVLNTGVGRDEVINPQRTVGIGALFVLEARVESNLVSYSDLLTRVRLLEDRALMLQGLLEISVAFGDRPFVLLGYSAQITNNKFLGRGADTLVEMLSRNISDMVRMRFERVFFSNNFVEHVGSNGDEIANGATVILTGSEATVMGNQVKSGTRFLPSFDFSGMDGPYIGNITTGRVINHVEFPVPENSFNSRV